MDSLMKNIPWDIKSTLNKVKNAVMNYTEMEAKVMEATTNDPWGASSTLLLEIARGTSNYQYFNESMPMIYKRMIEPQTQQQLKNWRQTYKSLQLLEYLLKNGDMRCIDNVRDHLYDIKSLAQNFRYVDEKGKDQGVNVRHRAKEISELVQDPERLQMERQKAAANRSKYTGVAAEEVRGGSYSGSNYNSGGFNSQSSYDPPPRKASTDVGKSNIPVPQMVSVAAVNVTGSNSNHQADLLDIKDGGDDFGEFTGSSNQAAPAQDDFADFVSAPSAAPQSQPANYSVVKSPLDDDFGSFTEAPTVQAPVQWNNMNTVPNSTMPVTQPLVSIAGLKSPAAKTSIKPADVWSSNLVSLDSLGKSPPPQTSGPPLSQLAVGQPQQSFVPNWSAMAPTPQAANYTRTSQSQQQSKQNFDDLLL